VIFAARFDMNPPTTIAHGRAEKMPSLDELGRDLLATSPAQRAWSIARPLVCFAAYFIFAFAGWWIPAVLAVAGLMFITYVSTSHDLLHRTLGFSRTVNDALLALTESLVLRSGHAFRVTHLQHHRNSRPAPISRNSGARSKTSARTPCRRNARAAASPPIPPPTIAMGGVSFFDLLGGAHGWGMLFIASLAGGNRHRRRGRQPPSCSPGFSAPCRHASSGPSASHRPSRGIA
jgi:fatty acid desaturase